MSIFISPFEFGSAAIKIGVWISLAGLKNLGRPKFELGSAHETIGVRTGPYCIHILLQLCE